MYNYDNTITGYEFIILCLKHGYKTYQEIADDFNNGNCDVIKSWGSKRSKPTLITQKGLYAIAKLNQWL